MKVLLLTRTLAQDCGGGRMSYEIASRMNSEIDLLVCTEHDSGEEYEKAILNTKGVWNLLRSAMCVRKLAKQYDIVHALDGWPFGLLAWFAVVGTKKKLFISGVGTYTIRPLDVWHKGPVLRRIYLRAKEIFCISTYVRNELVERVPRANASVVHLGTTQLPETKQEELIACAKKYNIPDGIPVVLTVGAVKDRKGQFDTVHAIHMLKERYPAIRYYIVGSQSDTVYVEKIKKYIREHGLEETIFLVSNAKTDADLAYFYSKATVFALNSNNGGGHFEGFGLVFLEAAQFGVPGVGSCGCGIEDAIADGVTGHLVGQRSHQAIADGIKKVIEQSDQYRKNALEWPKRFSWEKTVADYIEGYRR